MRGVCNNIKKKERLRHQKKPEQTTTYCSRRLCEACGTYPQPTSVLQPHCASLIKKMLKPKLVKTKITDPVLC